MEQWPARGLRVNTAGRSLDDFDRDPRFLAPLKGPMESTMRAQLAATVRNLMDVVASVVTGPAPVHELRGERP